MINNIRQTSVNRQETSARHQDLSFTRARSDQLSNEESISSNKSCTDNTDSSIPKTQNRLSQSYLRRTNSGDRESRQRVLRPMRCCLLPDGHVTFPHFSGTLLRHSSIHTASYCLPLLNVCNMHNSLTNIQYTTALSY